MLGGGVKIFALGVGLSYYLYIYNPQPLHTSYPKKLLQAPFFFIYLHYGKKKL